MKTDRELLELAAKAAGFGAPGSGEFTWTESEYPRKSGKHGALWNYVGWCDTAEMWNPLSCNNDAFRLIAELRMQVSVSDWIRAETIPLLKVALPNDGDTEAAMRRAITMAAAQLGEQK